MPTVVEKNKKSAVKIHREFLPHFSS